MKKNFLALSLLITMSIPSTMHTSTLEVLGYMNPNSIKICKWSALFTPSFRIYDRRRTWILL